MEHVALNEDVFPEHGDVSLPILVKKRVTLDGDVI